MLEIDCVVDTAEGVTIEKFGFITTDFDDTEAEILALGSSKTEEQYLFLQKRYLPLVQLYVKNILGDTSAGTTTDFVIDRIVH